MAELDVDLDVFEFPEQPNFPRLPNVVSRRGHRLKFNIGINEVPEGTKSVTISAKVFAYGPEHLGSEAHSSRSRRLWGSAEPKNCNIDIENLPAKCDIVVDEDDEDEHLGQGPYEAVITVTPTSANPENPDQAGEGEEFSIEFESM